jgi:hypothetical protein
MARCWKCGGHMKVNSRERVCQDCGRTVPRHKNQVSNNNYSTSVDGSGVLGTFLGLGLLGLALASSKSKNDAYDYDAYSLDEEEKREKRRAWIGKHWKGLSITIILLLVSVFVLVGYYESQLQIPIGYDSYSLQGKPYEEVVQLLKESGFTNIQTEKLEDLTIARENEENLVAEVKLIHTNVFTKHTEYPSNLWITVVYHAVELFSPPLTSKDAKGKNYEEVIAEFKKAGFTNISVSVEYDIVAGWFNDDGEVKSVSINGDSKYRYSDEYRLDAQIVITYHTWKSNKPD